MMEIRQMRSLDEILRSLREIHGYNEQEIHDLSLELDQIPQFSYMAYESEKRLSQDNQYGKPNI